LHKNLVLIGKKWHNTLFKALKQKQNADEIRLLITVNQQIFRLEFTRFTRPKPFADSPQNRIK